MLLKVFSLKFDAMLGLFNDTPLHDFIQDKEVLEIRDHMLVRNDIPYLILIIKYYPFRQEASSSGTSGNSFIKAAPSKSSEDWKKDLSDENLPLFNRLRDWRSERCKQDGVPPYIIFTNQQLIQIVKAIKIKN